ncbi:hypothetical protein T06_8125 [Trichinella sp. T6]|nr:hypothetical protein T06_8125 [Trichinella sp. T6]
MYHHLSMKTCLLKMFLQNILRLCCAFCSLLHVLYSSEMQIYVPEMDKICLMQQIGIREGILDITDLFLFNASFKSCIAYSYSDLNSHDYSIFAYNEKTSSCSMLHGMLEENIIANCSEQLHDLQFYKVTHCLPAEGIMYSFEEEVEENVNRISAVKLKATAEICIIERHPFSENFLLKRTGIFFLQSLELCLAHCRVLSVRGKCHAVLFSGEEKVCLLLRQNQPLQTRDVMRKSASQFFTLNYCYYTEEKTCLHLLLNASQALYEYSESKKETVHFIEKCVEVAVQQEYQQESAINHIQSDETSISSPSRPISSKTHNAREEELNFFHYVPSENVQEQYVKLHEFFEICKIHLLNINVIWNAFTIQILRKVYSLNRCLHICRRHNSCMAVLFSQLDHQCKKIFKGPSRISIPVHAHEVVVALKGCFKDRPDERKCNAEPLIYYFEETQQICAAEIYKQKNLTSWEVMAINKDIKVLYCESGTLVDSSNNSYSTIYVPRLDKVCLLEERDELKIYDFPDYSAFHLANLVEDFSEDGITENVTRINRVFLPALNEICTIERLPFVKNFAAKRLHKVLILNILTCFAHCRVLNWTFPCNSVLYSHEEGICLFLNYNDTHEESGTIRRNLAEFYSIKHCEFNRIPMVPNYDIPNAQNSESSFEFYMFNEQTLMECKIEKKHLQERYFSYITSLFSPVEFTHCLAICLNGYMKMVSCDAIYYAENGHSCLCFYLSQNNTVESDSENLGLHIFVVNSCKPATTLPIQQLTNVYDLSNLSENGNEEVYSYSDGNAVAAEANIALVQDSSVKTVKLHKFMEICYIQRQIMTAIDYVSVFTFHDPVWTLNMCLHRCRGSMHGESRCSAVLFSRLNRRCKLLSHANDESKYLIEPCEEFVSILTCAKVAILDIIDREMERIDNPEPVNFYLEELRQICKVEFYWKELKQLNNVTTFNKCLLSCIMESMRIPCSAINYSTSGECILLMNGGNDEFFKVKDGTLFGEIIDCELGNYQIADRKEERLNNPVN